ncbi:MAG TPA: DUF202 domain-containing protein [Chloroflexota bacterium]|nr:DUF202 domain-containing protein [Chloroflexota bacterium]
MPDREERPVSPGSVRDHLANERTLLSWVRLSLALTALGFVVARFGLFIAELAAAQGLRLARTGLSVPIGVLLVVIGPVFALLAFLRFLVVEREIDEGNIHHHHVLLYALVAMTALGSLGLAVYLVAVAIAVGPPIGGP